MAELTIRKASKKRARLRMAIDGQTGGGKTYSAILIAKHLIDEPLRLPEGAKSRVCVIDTERNSAENYQDLFDFDVIELPAPNHSPRDFTNAIWLAERDHDVVIVDSGSYEWSWCLTEVDRIAPRFGKNKWSAWSEVRPPHDTFVDTIMGSRAHVIMTMRAKMATVMEDEGGKKVVRQLGLESKQDDMIQYAFSVVLRMDQEHTGVVVKTRCPAIDNGVYRLPGRDLAVVLRNWLESGTAAEAPANIDAIITAAVTFAMSADGLTREEKVVAWNRAKDDVLAWCKGHGRTSEEATAAIENLKAKITEARAKAAANAAAQPAAGGDNQTAAA